MNIYKVGKNLHVEVIEKIVFFSFPLLVRHLIDFYIIDAQPSIGTLRPLAIEWDGFH